MIERARAWLRYRSLLAGLRLAPTDLSPEAPGPPRGDLILCGMPRSGTALLTAALFQPPAVVGVMEPWAALDEPPADLFARLHHQIAQGTLNEGRLDVEALAEGRVAWCRDGERPVPVQVEANTRLAVKFPTLWQYLDLELFAGTKFVVCIRDPLDVVTSFRHEGGRLAQGLEYPVRFNRQLNRRLRASAADPAARRVALYDEIGRVVLRARDRADVHVVRYERWFEDPEGLIHDLATFAELPLEPPQITVRRRPLVVHDEDRRAVREHCRTGVALGYPCP